MQAEGNATQDELKAQLALAHALGSGQAQVQVPSVSLANRVSRQVETPPWVADCVPVPARLASSHGCSLSLFAVSPLHLSHM